jgi:hypothetical protein
METDAGRRAHQLAIVDIADRSSGCGCGLTFYCRLRAAARRATTGDFAEETQQRGFDVGNALFYGVGGDFFGLGKRLAGGYDGDCGRGG